MIAVDTNVLVRALVDDPGERRQCTVARARLAQAKQVYVPLVVQTEMVWVLESAHRLTKPEVVSVLGQLRDNAAFHLQNRPQFEAALREFQTGGADFADYLIVAECRAQSASLLTFDKRLLKAPGTQAP